MLFGPFLSAGKKKDKDSTTTDHGAVPAQGYIIPGILPNIVPASADVSYEVAAALASACANGSSSPTIIVDTLPSDLVDTSAESESGTEELWVQLINSPDRHSVRVTLDAAADLIPKPKDRHRLLSTAKREFLWFAFHSLDVDINSFCADDPEVVKFESEYGIDFNQATDDVHLLAYAVSYQDKIAGQPNTRKQKSPHGPWCDAISYVLNYNKP